MKYTVKKDAIGINYYSKFMKRTVKISNETLNLLIKDGCFYFLDEVINEKKDIENVVPKKKYNKPVSTDSIGENDISES
jgi:hypothetical protein